MQSPHAGHEAGPLDILVAIFSDTEAWTIPRARVDDLRRRFPDLRFLHAENDEEMASYIEQLEQSRDASDSEAASGDVLAMEFERFLASQGDDDADGSVAGEEPEKL
jgi:hypothetical protein